LPGGELPAGALPVIIFEHNMSDLSLDLSRLRAAYRAAAVKPSAIVAEVLRRIDAAGDDAVWISRRLSEEIVADGETLDRRLAEIDLLPLYGIPFAVKDSIDVKGLPTTLACPAFAYEPAESAPVIDKLLAAGAILIGKTNLDQFATGLTGTRSPYGVPRNPFDSAMVPGGSSSGSAVAVASGLVSFAVGTDTAGSGRVPAAFNNLVGLKPTLGLISSRGLVPACRALDCITVLALTVPDALDVLRAAQGFDKDSPYSRAAPPAFDLNLASIPHAFRFGIPRADKREFFGDVEAKALFDRAIENMVAIGGTPVEIDFAPWIEVAGLLYGPWVAERTAEFELFLDAHAAEIHPVVREILQQGRSYSAIDVFHAQHRRQKLVHDIHLDLQGIEFMFVPTTGTSYRVDQVLADPVRLNTKLGYYTNFTNLLDLSAIAVPGSFTASGFPVGVTLIGPAWRDANLASFAATFHRKVDLPLGATGIRLPEF
jgi:allophanate hydrolase